MVAIYGMLGYEYNVNSNILESMGNTNWSLERPAILHLYDDSMYKHIACKDDVIDKAYSFYYGGMYPEELREIYDLCKDKKVIELGSMVGMSSYVIASVAEHVSCVDVWSDTQEHLSHDPLQQDVYKEFVPNLPNMLESFATNCKDYIELGKISMFRGKTEDMVHNFPAKTADILFIDADHSYIGVSNDYQHYIHTLKDNGYLLFHDYGGMWQGVKYLCDEMVAKGEIKLVKIVMSLAIFQKAQV